MCLKQPNIILIIYIIGSIFIFDSCSSADVAQVPALSFIAGTSGGRGYFLRQGRGPSRAAESLLPVRNNFLEVVRQFILERSPQSVRFVSGSSVKMRFGR